MHASASGGICLRYACMRLEAPRPLRLGRLAPPDDGCGLPYQFHPHPMLRCRPPGMPTSSMRLGSSLALTFTVLLMCAACAQAQNPK